MNPNADDQEPSGAGSSVFEVMGTMRAMRRLKPDPVPDEMVDRLIEAATLGPSASNAQAYAFVVVTDRAQMQRLAALWRRCVDAYLASFGRKPAPGVEQAAWDRIVAAVRYQRDHFAETPVLIVPCYTFPRADARSVAGLASLGAGGFARMLVRARSIALLTEAASVYPGVQNLLLTARALGLAANVATWHMFLEREWKAVLGIPRAAHTFAAIPVGWPQGRFGPVRRRPVAEVIHRDRW